MTTSNGQTGPARAEAGLLDELYRRPGFLIRRAHQIAVSIFTQECAAYDITATQYGVMFALSRCDGVDQITIARLLGLDRSTTGLVVSILEQRKLLSRSLHAEDKRKRVLTLTDTGRDLLALLRPCALDAIVRLLAPFPALERDMLTALLERMVNRLGGSAAADELAELYGRPGYLIRRAHQIAVAVFSETCREFDITTTQFGVMFALSRCDGVDQITLARLLGLDRSTTGLVVALLEERGLLQRSQHAEDRRRRVLALTAAGRTHLAAVMPKAVLSVERLLEPFTAIERNIFVELLDRLVNHHNADVRVPLIAESAG
ncbi:MarR family winged helix-turn-helix transcriptional regulator [Oleomonas cavernae]|nr:MarR family transcriptional regulator [Oleomonas cavernae]